MEKRETKKKNQIKDKDLQEGKKFEESDTEGFPKDLDFKKFLGCGG